MLKKNIGLFFFIICFISIKLFLINLYPINYEYSFLELSNYFRDYDKNILDDFKIINANTVVFSYTIYLISYLLPFLDILIIGRLLCLTSIFFIIFSLLKIKRIFNLKNNFLIIICLLNPIIWIYSSRISVDLLPASIIFFSVIILFEKKRKIFQVIISSLLFLYSVLLKPNLIALLSLPVLIIFFKDQISFVNIKKNFYYFIFYISIVLAGFLVYYFYSTIVLGHFISSVNNLVYSKSIFTVITNSFFYFGLLVIFITPVFFQNYTFFLKKNVIYFFLLGSSLFFYLGYINKYYFGEMDLGSFNFISTQILQGIYFIMALTMFIVMYNYFKILNIKEKNFLFMVLVSFIFYVILVSFFRPAQRYIMVFILFFIPIVFMVNKKINSKFYFFTIFIYVVLNLYFVVNNVNRSHLARTALNYIHENQLLYHIEPGVITDSYNWPSVRRQNLSSDKKKYAIVNTLSDKSKIKKKFEGKINIFNTKKYFLIEK